MASERSHLVTGQRPATDQPSNAEAEAQPLFGTKIRATVAEIKALRERRRGEGRYEEREDRPLFGTQIRETLSEIAEFRARRRAARDIARDD